MGSKSKQYLKGLNNAFAELGLPEVDVHWRANDALAAAEHEGIEAGSDKPARAELPECNGKRSYGSQEHAHAVMRSRQKAGAGRLRAYRCETCPHYHLTTKINPRKQ